MKLRRSKINIILASKRIKNEVETNKVTVIENKKKTLENIPIPDDFQIQIHKYYENVIFLWIFIILFFWIAQCDSYTYFILIYKYIF